MANKNMEQLKAVREIIAEAVEVSSRLDKAIAPRAKGAAAAGCVAPDPMVGLICGIAHLCCMLFSSRRLSQEQRRFLQGAQNGRGAVAKPQAKRPQSPKECIKYLTSLNRKLQKIIKDYVDGPIIIH